MLRVREETWKTLNRLKEPGDSFDDVIGRLIEQYGETPVDSDE